MRMAARFRLGFIVAVFSALLAVAATSAGNNATLPDAPARDLVARVCANCHALERVVDQRRSAEEWDRIIGVMVDRGAKASDEEQTQIRDYLVEHFGIK